MADDAKHDKILQRTQIILAILGAIVGLIVGVYNLRKMTKPEAPPAPVVIQVPVPPSSPTQSMAVQKAPGGEIATALDEVGASWLRKIAKSTEE